MKNILKYGAMALAMIGCGTQVVDFPEGFSSGGAGGSSSVSSVTVSSVSVTSSTSASDTSSSVVASSSAVTSSSTSVAASSTGSGNPCDCVTCPEGSVCKDGQCVPNDPCQNVTCPEGKVCKDGSCVCDGEDEPSSGCKSGKALLCHFAWGHPHDICVDDSAVPAHLNHGDKLGDCNLCE